MRLSQTPPTLGSIAFFSIAFLLASYFSFAAVQGNQGLFQRIETEAELRELRVARDRLQEELATLENRTRRLSDDFLDLDLLDQQLRDRLGYLRPDELVIR